MAWAQTPAPEQPESAKAPPLTAEQKAKLHERDQLRGKIKELQANGKLADAAGLLLKQIALEEAIFGEAHEETARSLNELGSLYYHLGRYADAEPVYRRSLKTYEARLGKEQPAVAMVLSNLALLYKETGRFDDAEPLFRRSLKIYEARLGEDHVGTAAALNNLALLYKDTGRYADAEPLFRRSLKTFEARLGKDHPHVAQSLNNLAELYRDLGRHADAEPLCQRSVKIREARLGMDHPEVAVSLNTLASLYLDMGRYAEAEPLFQRSLRIVEARLGKDHPYVGVSLHNLASLYRDMGRHADAEPLYRRSLKIYEARLGQDHPNVAISLNNLAILYREMDRDADAEPLFRRSLKIYEARLGQDHPNVAKSLNNLAELYRDMGRHADAEPLYQRSLKIAAARLGKDHPNVATTLNNLALLYQEMGRYADAEPLYQRSLKIYEAQMGQDHLGVATALNNLAYLYRDMSRHADAAPLYQRALRVVADHLDKTGGFLPERQLLALVHKNRFFLDNYLSLAPAAAADAYAWVSAWKGQAFLHERQLQLARRLHQAGDQKTAALYRRLEDTSRQLATLALAEPAPGKTRSPEELNQRHARLHELSQDVEALKQDLARRSQVFRRGSATGRLTPARLAAALPSNGILVDFLEYRHSSPPKAGKGPRQFERRLLAFVVRPDGTIDRVDLGNVAPISTAIDEWRKSFGRSAAGRQSAGLLRRLVWAPLEGKLQGAALVLVSPDGPLGRFPLAALPGKKPGTYLIEDCALTVLPVPRLLPQLLAADPVKDAEPSLLAVGGVDYDEAELGKAGELVSSRKAARAGDLQAWPALPNTLGEVLVAQRHFQRRYRAGRVVVLDGKEATEAAFRKEAPQHRYVHLATHGFFAPPKLRSALRPPMGKDRAAELFGDRGVAGYHPGLLSGLVLAGANRPAPAGQDDGILTAVEVAVLDLGQVELAVLSACETGLGESAGGEGLLGLQRAFQVAGARSVVASLWQVDDRATRALMERFYDNLWNKKLSKLEGLRQAQLWMLPRAERASAGWTLTRRSRRQPSCACRPTTGPPSFCPATGARGACGRRHCRPKSSLSLTWRTSPCLCPAPLAAAL
jgi:CHAT domain-containing protein/lipopolysaccharide biosynthesis regulator YciM